MNRYEKYKDSGIQWLGEIPEHWGCSSLKRLINIYNGCDYKDIECSEGVPVFGSGGPFTFAKEVMYDGEVVMYGRKGTIDKPLYYKGAFWTIDTMFYSVIKSDKLIAKFQYYVSTQMPLKKLSTSTALPSMTMTTLGGISIPLPPLSEQQTIVSYLDDKCGKIDEWLGKKQKEVEHLQELKQRIIADAVTRGLNPDVKMKSTNIPWLPEIPEHWEVKTLRNFLTMFADKGYGDKQLLSVTREQGVIVRNTDSKEENHNFIPEDLSNYKYVQEGDFVINKMKSWQGSYGVSEHEGIVSPAYFTCKLYGVDKSFFSTAIRSKVYVSFFGRYSKGIRVDQWDLSPIGLKSIPFLLPPLSEQKQIVSYIKEKTTKIDTLVANINKEIENIKEYKQRLVSDVVTGQIKVCKC